MQLHKSRVWAKVLEGSTLILDISELSSNTVYDKLREASVPKNELDLFSRFRTVPACDGNGVVCGS